MTQKRLFLFLIALLPVMMISCGDDDDDDLQGKWYRMSDFDGLARSYASSFTIGNKGYLACGYNGKTKPLSDVWEYDMDRDSWTQKADFPGVARNTATAMTINQKGYLGTGYDSENYLKDFWEYDPASNTWTQKADFPGSARYDATAFGINGKGYMGSGYDGNYLKDFYAFDPSTNSWTQIVSIGGSKRRGATSFVLDNIAYVCCGTNNGGYVDDFWKFDPSDGTWTQLRDMSDSSDESYDDDYNMTRMHGPKGVGWDYVPEGTKNVFGGEARYVVNSLTEDQSAEIKKDLMSVGPQADLAPFRLSMLPEAEDIYQPGNYEQRITLDTQKVEQYIPKERLDYTVFIPLDMADDYAEIQTNLNSFVRMATVQFITGERDIENGWDQYLSELDSYRVDRYIEIYKAATGR